MSARSKILRYVTGSAPAPAEDELSVEEPLEIRVKSRAVSVTMRTPPATTGAALRRTGVEAT